MSAVFLPSWFCRIFTVSSLKLWLSDCGFFGAGSELLRGARKLPTGIDQRGKVTMKIKGMSQIALR
jgi:hypothetical protein